MRQLLCVLIVLCSGYAALAEDAETTMWRPGQSFAKSPDQAFIRQWVLQMEDYEVSQDYRPWDVDAIEVSYFDVNDDGIDEMELYFEVSSFFCGTAGCQTFYFQKRDEEWREIGHGIFPNGTSPDGEERIQGYRTLYSTNGMGMRWTGEKYEQACLRPPPETSDGEMAYFCRPDGRR